MGSSTRRRLGADAASCALAYVMMQTGVAVLRPVYAQCVGEGPCLIRADAARERDLAWPLYTGGAGLLLAT